MSNKIQKEYMCFYLEARAGRVMKTDIDVEKLAREILDGKDVREAVFEACVRAVAPLEFGRQKAKWIADHQEEITAAGGDADAAYGAWLAGRRDDLAADIEDRVLDEIGGMIDGFDEDEDDEDAEDDDEDEED